MKKRKFLPFIIAGACLVLISFSLLIGFLFSVHIGIRKCDKLVAEMYDILPDKTVGSPGSYLNANMPVLEINETDYVALLDIPSFGVTLPVADKWDSNKLYLSPARFFGSVYDSTLIIGGFDHPQQLGFGDKIEHGAIVTITDMTGVQFTYAVSHVERSKHANTQWLTEGDCDLTLFYRDLYTMEYIAIRCDITFN